MSAMATFEGRFPGDENGGGLCLLPAMALVYGSFKCDIHGQIDGSNALVRGMNMNKR